MAVTIDAIGVLLENNLKMNMDIRNAKSRMKGMFANYHSLLSQQRLVRIIEEKKLAAMHAPSAIRPQALREGLASQLSFSHHNLEKDFKEFLKQAFKLSEDFQTVDNGTKKKMKKNETYRSGGNPGGPKDNGKDKNRKRPLYIWDPYRK